MRFLGKLDRALLANFELPGGWIGTTKKNPIRYFRPILFNEQLYVIYLRTRYAKYIATVVKPGNESNNLIDRLTDEGSIWSPDLFESNGIKISRKHLNIAKEEAIRLAKIWLSTISNSQSLP